MNNRGRFHRQLHTYHSFCNLKLKDVYASKIECVIFREGSRISNNQKRERTFSVACVERGRKREEGREGGGVRERGKKGKREGMIHEGRRSQKSEDRRGRRRSNCNRVVKRG